MRTLEFGARVEIEVGRRCPSLAPMVLPPGSRKYYQPTD